MFVGLPSGNQTVYIYICVCIHKWIFHGKIVYTCWIFHWHVWLPEAKFTWTSEICFFSKICIPYTDLFEVFFFESIMGISINHQPCTGWCSPNDKLVHSHRLSSSISLNLFIYIYIIYACTQYKPNRWYAELNPLSWVAPSPINRLERQVHVVRQFGGDTFCSWRAGRQWQHSWGAERWNRVSDMCSRQLWKITFFHG